MISFWTHPSLHDIEDLIDALDIAASGRGLEQVAEHGGVGGNVMAVHHPKQVLHVNILAPELCMQRGLLMQHTRTAM